MWSACLYALMRIECAGLPCNCHLRKISAQGDNIPTYLIKLLDHGAMSVPPTGLVADAIRRAKAMDVVRIGAGHDFWEGERLAFRHIRGGLPLSS